MTDLRSPYIIVEAGSASELASKVCSQMLNEGRYPIGGPVKTDEWETRRDGTSEWFIQAMVLK